ncbi:augurin isoform X3 [Pongo abelii]|uniref:augurin isoform X3 n=1 Tax=Pongo abelii TaxID=9601 RepID=UPI0023E8C056|nr:augurin isoform X3 [Pongo abelii]
MDKGCILNWMEMKWQYGLCSLASCIWKIKSVYSLKAPVPTKTKVAVDENKAKEFLGSLKRQKRQLWDRTRPEVQQWYQQFLYMGFDEAKFEDDITYWLNRDRNGHEYYGDYYQRHYDEDSAIGPRSPYSFRHGASVNYDDY